jgi:hypothetical protein
MWDVAPGIAGSDATWPDWWLAAQKKTPKDCCRAFDTMAMLACWMLWKERNARVFKTTLSPKLVGCLRTSERKARSGSRPAIAR